MKIIFFGTPIFVVPILKELAKHFEVIAVVTTPDQKSGRKQLLTSPAVKVFAEENNLRIIQPTSNDSLKSLLLNLKSDIFVVAAYGKLIPNELLQLPTYGAINIHPSLLPKYRGPTPIQTALLNAETITGISFIKMDEEMDHGQLVAQYPVAIKPTDTFESLMNGMFEQSAELLPQIINDYASGKLKPQPQDDTKATYTKKITKEDGYIDLAKPPLKEILDLMIRAYYPWPTTWTKVTIHNRELLIKFLPEEKLQVEGKKPLNIKDFLNGYPKTKELLSKLFE